jgi:hypothetical protein
VLDRGEKFELLVDRTDKLNRQSVKFERSTVQLRKTMWRRNVKLWMLLVFVGLVRDILDLKEGIGEEGTHPKLFVACHPSLSSIS